MHLLQTMKILLIFLVAICLQSTARKLIFFQCINRHGVRYPSYPNNIDYSNITEQRHAQSQLAAQGRQMLFLLGRSIYAKYWKIMFEGTKYEKNYEHSLIYAKSTNSNRTIESLENLLEGFLVELQPDKDISTLKSSSYPPFFTENFQTFTHDQFYQTWKKSHFVPIHVQKGAEGDPGIANKNNEGDFLVKEEFNLCPNSLNWQSQNINSQFVQQLMKNKHIQFTINKIKPLFGALPLDFNNIYKYVDNYKCLKAIGLPYLQIFQDPQINQYLQFLYLSRLYVVYLHTDIQIKTFSKTLLSITINNMKNAISKTGPNIVFYSGHDITVAFMLVALNFTNLKCLYQKYMMNQSVQHCYWQYPSFASTFILQLWEENDSTYSIEVAINGEKYPIPICNYSMSCPLEHFQNWFNNFTIKQTPNQICGVDQHQSLFYIHLLCFAGGMAAAMALFYFFPQRRQPSVAHHGISQEENIV